VVELVEAPEVAEIIQA